MKLVEVRRGHTASDVIAASTKLIKRIGEVAVLEGVCSGFISKRVLSIRGRDANKTVLEGAMLCDVDRALYDFGFHIGLFQMNELTGPDIGWVMEEIEKLRSSRGALRGGTLRQKNGAGYRDRREPQPKCQPLTEKIRFSDRMGNEATCSLLGPQRGPIMLNNDFPVDRHAVCFCLP
ncbi:3-hydroxyacyl-CoA dehydrogenase family protein [Bradyrhizobium sp. LMG 9283]|uniref:3-hydroxyacyl-CoA dehydrogenase family protein n=1 Tax=Bradyrhizobium sp. LMG 9283 TaxID=592064 RepID=UPI00388D5DDD